MFRTIFLIGLVGLCSCSSDKGTDPSLSGGSAAKIPCDSKSNICLPGNCQSSADCPFPYNSCTNNLCLVEPAPQNSDKIWFATDPIRPGVTGTCNAFSCAARNNDYIYNIMAKGYASLDDWCMHQAQQSTDPNVRNKSGWLALIVANGAPTGLGVFLTDRIAPAFYNVAVNNFPQSAANPYATPNSGNCVFGLCDKFGGQPAQITAPGAVVTTAWLGFDAGCLGIQLEEGCGGSWYENWNNGNTQWNPGIDTYPTTSGKYWSEFANGVSSSYGTFQNSGSVYVADANHAAPACGYFSFNPGQALCIFNNVIGGSDDLETAVTSSKPIICLSVN